MPGVPKTALKALVSRERGRFMRKYDFDIATKLLIRKIKMGLLPPECLEIIKDERLAKRATYARIIYKRKKSIKRKTLRMLAAAKK